MSRIGKKPISIPGAVEIKVSSDNVVTAKGPKGELSQSIPADLKVTFEDAELTIERPDDSKAKKAAHGLYRTLLFNIVDGVNVGFKKELELVGVGFKAVCQNNVLELNLGYSHNIYFALPQEVKGTAISDKGKNPKVILESADKQLIGQVAAKIKSLRKMEPYKGKGVRLVDDFVRRKVGKTAAK